MNRKKGWPFLKTSLKIAISLALLAWFLIKADRTQMVRAFFSIPVWLWPLLFSMYLTSQVLSSIRWYVLAEALGFSGRWLTYLCYYFSGMFFNLFLPTSIGGDIIKIFFISRGENRNRKILASYSVLADRLFGLASLLLFGAAAALANPDILPAPFPDILVWGGAVTVCALCFMPLIEKAARGRTGQMIEKALRVLLVFWRHPVALAVGIGFSMLIQSLCILMCVLIGMAMGIQAPPVFYFAAFPLVALLTLLPVSFNGIGVREGAFVYFLGLRDVPSGEAVMLSLIFFAVQVAASLVGGVVYSTGSYKKTGIET